MRAYQFLDETKITLSVLNDEQPVAENFADGKGPGRPGDSVRHGIPKKATMAELEKARAKQKKDFKFNFVKPRKDFSLSFS